MRVEASLGPHRLLCGVVGQLQAQVLVHAGLVTTVGALECLRVLAADERESQDADDDGHHAAGEQQVVERRREARPHRVPEPTAVLRCCGADHLSGIAAVYGVGEWVGIAAQFRSEAEPVLQVGVQRG